MEEFLGAADVQPHLPKYYPAPNEAKVQLQIMDGFRCRLDLVKGVQSHDKLAYWEALLDAAVAGDVHRQGQAFAPVLQVRPQNVKTASERRSTLESEGERQFSLPKRRKRSDVLDPDVVAKVKDWYHRETMISPCRKDTQRQRIGPKDYVEHPVHLFLETLVRVWII
jgi:hypothetical protein